MADAEDDAPMAALRALRQHVIAGKSVEVDGDDLVFRDAGGAELRRFAKHTPTAYHSKKLDKRYDLLAVFTCYKYAGLTFSDYVMKCRSEKAIMVSTVDKKELIAYLKGDSDTSAQILDAAGKPTAGSGHSEGAKPSSRASASSSERRADAAARKGTPTKKVARGEAENEDRAAKKRKLAQESGREHRRREKETRRGEGHAAGGDHGSGTGDVVMKRITEKEAAVRNRTTILDAHKTTFENVLKTLELVNAETKEKIEKASKASSLLAPTNARKEQLPLHRLVKERFLGTPIIVVPAGFSDLFTMLNAKDFLEDGVYVSNMQKKAEGHRKAQSMMISHEKDGHTYTFKVVDTVSRFRDKDWYRSLFLQRDGVLLICDVVVSGSVCGVHIYNQGSQLNDEIKQWDVKVLMVSCTPLPRLQRTTAREAHSTNVALRHRKKQHGEQPSVTELAGAQEQIDTTDARAGPHMPASSASSQQGVPLKQIGNGSARGALSENGGPNHVLKTAMTLSHFPSSRNMNKVAPEDVVPPPPLTRKQKVLAFVEHKYVSAFMTMCTIFALFGDDFRVSFFPKSADTSVYNTLFALFIFFSIELMLNIYSRPNYFNRGMSFSFYMDLISTLSVIPDVEWIWVHVVGTSDTSSASQAAALKAGRASRAGTKAGRIVRLVRLFRMLRILRVIKKNKSADAKAVQISEPSKIGKVLTEKTTRLLIVLVLLIIIISPIIDGTVDLTQDDFQTSQFERLHRYTQDYNQSGDISMDHFHSLVNEYVRDSNGLIVQMEITNISNADVITWMNDLKFQPLDSSQSDWLFGSAYTLTKNPKTDWYGAGYLVNDPTAKYRSTEITTVDNLGCYVDDKCLDCGSDTPTSICHSFVTFDISSYTKSAANLNIIKTIVVMICFGVSIFVLTRDAETMVIGPIERMMRLVTQLAENPLGATEAKREIYEDETKGDADYETKMLENTLGKIGRLLQVGFGAAGTEIIAKNMGGA
ncbi:hypothetical protein BBJ28_00003447, partial [Nothophytophthora sp. Chile5]